MYDDYKLDRSHLQLVMGYSADEVVEYIKSIFSEEQTSTTSINRETVCATNENSTRNSIDDEDHVQQQPIQEMQHSQQQSIQETQHDQNSVDSSTEDNQNSIQQRTSMDGIRAARILCEGLVQYYADSKAFIVRSLDGHSDYTVNMKHPNQLFWCSCPAKGQSCKHILSVKSFLGNHCATKLKNNFSFCLIFLTRYAAGENRSKSQSWT